MTVLVVDDEKNIRRTLSMILSSEGFEVNDVSDGAQALDYLANYLCACVILDINMPGIDGKQTLVEIQKKWPGLPVIMISGHANISDAVECLQYGAFDFFEKPLNRERVILSVKNATNKSKLLERLERLQNIQQSDYPLIGESATMKKLSQTIEKAAPTNGKVLISGESGTGKEHVARAIHRLSKRNKQAFVRVNCAAFPNELIESELFGYEKGAFTGAENKKSGFFELADGGTIFLDEIGDMGLKAQAKVLRTIQSGELVRVGSEKIKNVDVRVIAATNKDLKKQVSEGNFREDLYFRLNVLPIDVPPLRERKGDIVILAQYFLEKFLNENGLKEKQLSDECCNLLESYHWPGNVRELSNIIERLSIFSGDMILASDLPKEFQDEKNSSSDDFAFLQFSDMTLKEWREFSEKAFIESALRKHSWNVTKAATVLGVERSNLHKKIKYYNLEK